MTPIRSRGRLIAWLVFVGLLALLSYAARLSDTQTPDDIAYRYSSSIAAAVQYALMLGALLLIVRGLPRRQAFALQRPVSWPRAIGLAVLSLLAIYLGAVIYDRV
ncbi:MAG: hypothetical protein OEW47_07170, partial [Thermoleophilia bacterium]|nr:hypothetical protein [Thermoleophilia bacterium]